MSNTQIIRLFTREPGSSVANAALDCTRDAEVVVEVEASTADWNEGALYEIGLTIEDLDGGQTVRYPTETGSMTRGSWTDQSQPFPPYTIPATELKNHTGHVCQAHAYLLVGAVDRQVDFAVSPMFLVV